jgi:hypothetical protein
MYASQCAGGPALTARSGGGPSLEGPLSIGSSEASSSAGAPTTSIASIVSSVP